MLEFYEAYRPNVVRAHLVQYADKIIKEYQEQNLSLTLRQLYYQLVSRDVIPNKVEEYNRLGDVVSRGRRGGFLEWGAIEDRIRRPQVPQEFDSLEDLLDVATRAYRLPRMKGQRFHVELWVEKDALAGVLAPIANEYHIPLMVNRGYSSTSAMKEAGERVRETCLRMRAEEAIIFYLGDFDPSGEDMVRDISDRLGEYMNEGRLVIKDDTAKHGMRLESRHERYSRASWVDLRVEKIGLTMEQIQEHRPPPNPAKQNDPRFKKFKEEHGDQSWEVDALPPTVLRDIIVEALEGVIDLETMEEVKIQEMRDKTHLAQALKAIREPRVPVVTEKPPIKEKKAGKPRKKRK